MPQWVEVSQARHTASLLGLRDFKLKEKHYLRGANASKHVLASIPVNAKVHARNVDRPSYVNYANELALA